VEEGGPKIASSSQQRLTLSSQQLLLKTQDKIKFDYVQSSYSLHTASRSEFRGLTSNNKPFFAQIKARFSLLRTYSWSQEVLHAAHSREDAREECHKKCKMQEL
jgi:hypothetical protein